MIDETVTYEDRCGEVYDLFVAQLVRSSPDNGSEPYYYVRLIDENFEVDDFEVKHLPNMIAMLERTYAAYQRELHPVVEQTWPQRMTLHEVLDRRGAAPQFNFAESITDEDLP